MIFDVKLEKLSGQNKSGTVGKILKKNGEDIKKGDNLLDIEAKKGNITVKSEVNGKIIEFKITEGDNISIGDIIFSVDSEEIEHKKDGFNYMANFIKPQKIEEKKDLVIIGGGPGGYVAAIEGAKSGLSVVLIEKDSLGGTCLNRGCIPTKAFVRSSEVYELVKKSEDFGIINNNYSFDFSKIVDRKNGIVSELVGGIDYLLNKNGITIYKGIGEVLDKNTVFVKEANKEITINSKNIIIATGSTVSTPKIKGIDSNNVITSNEILDIKSLPEKLIIVGGGVIGMEFAFICNALDKDVSVVEFADDILISLDEDIRDEVRNIALDKGIKIYTNSKVEEIIDSTEEKSIVVFSKNGKSSYLVGDKILMAVGRKPYFGDIDLDKIGIELDERQLGIKVNDKLQTSVDNIYAIGDVTNKIQLAHVASHQAVVAIENILGNEKIMDYEIVPSAIFTMPEISCVGITEREAREKDLNIVVGKFPFGANGKSLTLGEKRGFVKIIAEENSNTILGASIIGPNATDLIHEISIAVRNKMTTDQIIDTIHAHPTTSESIHEAFLATTKKGAIHFAN